MFWTERKGQEKKNVLNLSDIHAPAPSAKLLFCRIRLLSLSFFLINTAMVVLKRGTNLKNVVEALNLLVLEPHLHLLAVLRSVFRNLVRQNLTAVRIHFYRTQVRPLPCLVTRSFSNCPLRFLTGSTNWFLQILTKLCDDKTEVWLVVDWVKSKTVNYVTVLNAWVHCA